MQIGFGRPTKWFDIWSKQESYRFNLFVTVAKKSFAQDFIHSFIFIPAFRLGRCAGPTALKRLKMHGRVITFNGNIETNASENTFETSNGKLHSFSFASCKHYTIEQQFRLTTDRVLEGLIGAETGLCRRTTVRRDNRALGRPGATEKLRRKFHDRSNNGALQVRRTLAWQHAQQSAARAPELRSAMCKYLQWTGWGGFR